MIITQNNRVFTTTGAVFTTLDEVKNYVDKHPTEIITSNLNQVKFLIIDDMIYADLGPKKLPFSEEGLKSVCSIIKAPFSYLNKLMSNDLILKNLNESPNLFQDEYLFYIHQTDDKQEYISAVSNCETFKYEQAIQIIESTELFNNIDMKCVDVTLSNENIVFYFLSNLSIDFNEKSSFLHGLCVSIPEGLNNVAEISPFIRVTFHEHNSFDFISKPLKRVRRVEKSFAALLKDELDQFTENNFTEITDELIKLLDAAFNASEISYLQLKRIKSNISNTFRFQDGVYDTKNIVTELLPEYDTFRATHKEDIRTKATFEINNYKINYFLPRFFSGFEGHVFTLENPIFFNKQRKNVFRLLQHHADIYYASI